MVIAINMMDIVRKNGDKINIDELSQALGCKVVEISALKGDGVMAAAEAAIDAAKNGKTVPMHTFSGPVEHAIAHIEEAAVHTLPEEQQRWYAIKIFERDDKVLQKLSIPADVMQHIEQDIQAAEKELDDDAESIITNERYVYIAEIIKSCYKQKRKGQLSTSDKIDKVVTNRWLGLPIFAAVMFLVYWIAMVAVGAPATDWANAVCSATAGTCFGSAPARLRTLRKPMATQTIFWPALLTPTAQKIWQTPLIRRTRITATPMQRPLWISWLPLPLRMQA